MKSIITGVRYDTDSATEIGGFQYSYPGDFNYWKASLYVTPKSGRYFLAGEGGPMTHYSRTIGQNNWSGGEKISPLTKDQAFEWAQKYLTPEEVEVHFGDLIEDA